MFNFLFSNFYEVNYLFRTVNGARVYGKPLQPCSSPLKDPLNGAVKLMLAIVCSK